MCSALGRRSAGFQTYLIPVKRRAIGGSFPLQILRFGKTSLQGAQTPLPARRDGDDFEAISVGEGATSEIGRGEGGFVVLDDHRFPLKAESLEESRDGEILLEVVGFAVDNEGHDFARMAGSQSFQTGSNP